MKENIARLYDKHSIKLNPLVQAIIKSVKKGHKVIDLGCGSGEYIHLLEKQVGNNGLVTGVDINNEMIKFCNKKFKKRNILFIRMPAEKLSSMKEKADVVFSSLVLHFTNAEKTMAEIKKSLKPNGKLIFAVPLYRSGLEIFDNEESKKFKSKFIINLKNEFKKNNIAPKISLDYANSREKFFKKLIQKNKFKIVSWKIASLEKANLKVLLEYFKIPWRSEKISGIQFSIRYKVLKSALENTFKDYPDFKSNRYYLVGTVSKNN